MDMRKLGGNDSALAVREEEDGSLTIMLHYPQTNKDFVPPHLVPLLALSAFYAVAVEDWEEEEYDLLNTLHSYLFMRMGYENGEDILP